ncbi:MAG: hypothetical protein LBQ45_01290 [Mycoplasmataceae bacterium]|jgi:hypothetical protein|nr:hypothetical protein [Mycoplasmataceae bacterium]
MQLSFNERLGNITISPEVLNQTINNIIKRIIVNAKINNVIIKEVNDTPEIKITLSHTQDVNFINELSAYISNINRYVAYNLNIKKCNILISLNKN